MVLFILEKAEYMVDSFALFASFQVIHCLSIIILEDSTSFL